MVSIMGMVALLIAQVAGTPGAVMPPDTGDLGVQFVSPSAPLPDEGATPTEPQSADPADAVALGVPDAAAAYAVPEWACEATPLADLQGVEVEEVWDQGAVMLDGAVMVTIDSEFHDRSFVIAIDITEIGYTPMIAMFEGGNCFTVQLAVENILEYENGQELSLEADLLAVELAGAGEYGDSLKCHQYWTGPILNSLCVWQMPDGRVRVTLDYLFGDRRVRVFDSGWFYPDAAIVTPQPASGQAANVSVETHTAAVPLTTEAP